MSSPPSITTHPVCIPLRTANRRRSPAALQIRKGAVNPSQWTIRNAWQLSSPCLRVSTSPHLHSPRLFDNTPHPRNNVLSSRISPELYPPDERPNQRAKFERRRLPHCGHVGRRYGGLRPVGPRLPGSIVQFAPARCWARPRMLPTSCRTPLSRRTPSSIRSGATPHFTRGCIALRLTWP